MSFSGFHLDADARALVDQVTAADAPTLQQRGVEAARQYIEDSAATSPPGPEIEAVHEHLIDGSTALRVRVYRPAAPAAVPVVTYFHGGGWVLGSVTASDAFCRRLAVTVPCIVVSVEYRLAPERPWPAAVEDAGAAIVWAARHAEELGGDPERVVVLGDSAGGNVATVATCRLSKNGAVPVARQILAYPTISTRQDSVSHSEHGQGWPLASSDLAWFVELYAPAGTDRAHPDVSPLHADVSKMPATTVLLAGCDPLLDEGMEYVKHLAAASVPVDVHVFAGQIHGLLTFPEDVLPRSREALGIVANAVRCA